MARSFKLLSTLGEGAFGAVHLAEVRDDDDFVQTLAVKWLHPQWSESLELTRRLRDEARLLALLHHDHIVRVHGLTTIEGRLAILMEPVDGTDLSELAECPPRAALEIVAAVADALDDACHMTPPGHDGPLNVVHRDIKPSNVMVTRRGHVKVMDFGVARANFDAREAETRSQQFGTARYMAPERWLDGVAEAPSDIFSLGVTLLELLASEPMEQPRLSREGFERDLVNALHRLEAWPEISDLVGEMCQFNPDARPSARAVEERCRALSATAKGIGLREWASVHVQASSQTPIAGQISGTVVVEDTAVPGISETVPLTFVTQEVGSSHAAIVPRGNRRRQSLVLAGLGVSAVIAAYAFVQSRDAPEKERPVPEPTAQSQPAPTEPQPTTPPVPEKIAVPDPPTEPEPSQPRPEPAAPVSQPALPVPEPEQKPEQEPEPQQVNVTFTIADGVEVETADGQRFGGPIKTIKMPEGDNQTITLYAEGRTETCTFYVGHTLTNVKVDANLRC